jgi:hypothetical protein
MTDSTKLLKAVRQGRGLYLVATVGGRVTQVSIEPHQLFAIARDFARIAISCQLDRSDKKIEDEGPDEALRAAAVLGAAGEGAVVRTRSAKSAG